MEHVEMLIGLVGLDMLRQGGPSVEDEASTVHTPVGGRIWDDTVFATSRRTTNLESKDMHPREMALLLNKVLQPPTPPLRPTPKSTSQKNNDTDANASLGSPLQQRERRPEPKVSALKQTTGRSHPQADSPQSYGGIVRVAVQGENVSVAEMVERRRSAGLAARGERENGGERGNDARGSRPGSCMSNTSTPKKSGRPISGISPSGVNRRVRFQGDAELSPDADTGVPSSASPSSPAARSCPATPRQSAATARRMRPEFPFTPGASAAPQTLGQDRFKRRPADTIHPKSEFRLVV